MNFPVAVPPGSAAYLLRHELRIGWRRSGFARAAGGAPRPERGRRVIGWTFFLIIAALLQMAAFPIAKLMAGLPADASRTALAALSGSLAVLWALMVSHALDSGTQAIFLRGDHDLLISSPIPPRRVFAIRALTIAVNVVTVYAAITLPLVLALLWYGQWRWLSIYPMLTSLGLSATAIGLTLCFALFGLIGPRRTRIVAQVMGACVGALVFLITQSEKLLPADWRAAIVTWAGTPADAAAPMETGRLIWWPARALMGEAAPNLALLFVSAAAFALLVWSFGERFARNAVMAADLAVPAAPKAGRQSRQRGLRVRGPFAAQAVKEWRLLVRDPWLISQSLMQTLYLMPICFAFAGGGSASLLVPMTVILAGNLASGLVWVTLRAEDAPDLIASAPVSRARARAAKLLAALAPVALILTLPLTALAWHTPTAALAAMAGCAAAVLGAVALAFCTQDHGSRKDFAKRHKRSLLAGLAEPISHVSWGAAAALALDANPWAFAPAAAALLLIGVVWVCRPPSNE